MLSFRVQVEPHHNPSSIIVPPPHPSPLALLSRSTLFPNLISTVKFLLCIVFTVFIISLLSRYMPLLKWSVCHVLLFLLLLLASLFWEFLRLLCHHFSRRELRGSFVEISCIIPLFFKKTMWYLKKIFPVTHQISPWRNRGVDRVIHVKLISSVFFGIVKWRIPCFDL